MTVLYFILLIGVLIFVHELGHFLFAKLFDVKVLKFVLGFGPRAAGFRRGETEYCVAWLPLGGYVKMLGDDPDDVIEPADQGRAFAQKPLWQRYIVVFAGPVFNLIFPTFIYFFFFAAQSQLPPAVIGKVFAGKPAANAGMRPGDRVVAIDGDPIRYWEEMQRTISDNPQRPLRFTIERDGKRLQRPITPELQSQPTRLGLTVKEGRIGIANYFEPVQVGISDPRSPAAQAGLRTGDVIHSIDGQPVGSWGKLRELLAERPTGELRIAYFRPGRAGTAFSGLYELEPHTAVVRRPAPADGSKRTIGIYPAERFALHVEAGSPAAKIGMRAGDRVTRFDGKPLEHWETIQITLGQQLAKEHQIAWVRFGGERKSGKFKLARVTFLDDYRQEQERYIFGARNELLRQFAEPVAIESRITHAVTSSVRRTGEIIGMMAVAVVQLMRGAIPSDTIGGPGMLYHTAGVAARKGWDHFLAVMALISINLGILNLLPIPILDGGHILLFTIEAIKRRPLSLRAREIASYIGLFLVVSLMVLAVKNDIVRYLIKK